MSEDMLKKALAMLSREQLEALVLGGVPAAQEVEQATEGRAAKSLPKKRKHPRRTDAVVGMERNGRRLVKIYPAGRTSRGNIQVDALCLKCQFLFKDMSYASFKLHGCKFCHAGSEEGKSHLQNLRSEAEVASNLQAEALGALLLEDLEDEPWVGTVKQVTGHLSTKQLHAALGWDPRDAKNGDRTVDPRTLGQLLGRLARGLGKVPGLVVGYGQESGTWEIKRGTP